MCGICGMWGSPDEGAVRAMMVAMRHRGPDDSGLYADEQVSLGMTRLAIIDTSAAGHQPMRNGDGSIWAVYNGETYNFQSERALLEARGHVFLSNSDTEVVLRMYEQYGDDFLNRMRGMFALALYDRRGGPGRERLLLARDHFGIKPLLYARTGGRLVFASEVKALLASGLVEPEVDPVALRLLLTYGSVYQPRTILRGVSMLPPAHRLVVEGGRERVERYWSLSAGRRPELRGRPYEELVAEVSAVLEESVRLQMVSDVPLGAFLSGGVDSSLLVALMARAAGSRVKTFSLGYGDEGRQFDETDEAERTARFLGTDHTRVRVSGADVRDEIHDFARGLDQPSVDGINTYFVSKEARRAVTVAISGNGGDELFVGYRWFISMVRDESRRRARPVEAAARALLAALARRPLLDPLLSSGRVGHVLHRARGLAGFTTVYGNNYQIFGPRGAARLISPELRGAAQSGRSLERDLAALDEVADGSTIQRVSGLCLRGYNSNQLLRDSDAVSMIHSLEVRVPFLDPVVADVALALPDGAKLGGVAGAANGDGPPTYRSTGAKRILFDVGRHLLPADFDLQPKRGFLMPFNAWLTGPLREVFLDTVTEESVRARGLLNVEGVADVRGAVLRGGRFGWMRPWLLLTLELWCREVLDRAAANSRCDVRAAPLSDAGRARHALN
jgi:asparagine synthase (glutamine-hydrolysing)